MLRMIPGSILTGLVTVSLLSLGLSLGGCATGSTDKKELTHPQRAALLLELGNGALIEGDPTGALSTLMQAQQEDPEMPEIHHSLALAYYGKSDLSDALKEAQKAVELSPNYPDANNTLGKILLDLGRYDEARTPLLTAAQNPLYREAYKSWTNLGILNYRQGDFAKASRDFAKAIDGDRESACIAYYYRGHLKLRSGEYSDAIRDYAQATKKTCGGFADAHLAIAITYERTKQFGLARRGFLDIEQKFPNSKAADQALQHLKSLP